MDRKKMKVFQEKLLTKKQEILAKFEDRAAKVESLYQKGVITDDERPLVFYGVKKSKKKTNAGKADRERSE